MSSITPATASILKLPACERCRIRKVRCDTQPPKCGPCRRNNSACIIVDPISRAKYTRDGIYELEQKLQRLESSAGAISSTSPIRSPSALSANKAPRTHFVGDGSGLQVLKQLSTGARTALRFEDHSPTVQGLSPSSAAIAPHNLPPPEVADVLVNQYLTHVQLHHPLLAEEDVTSTYHRVYGPEGQAAAEDLYRLYMIFAIASVTTYRRGHTQYHPYGYFRAAQRYSSQARMVGDVQGIQNVLLIARFSMYYHVDCSIWDLARFCIRQCISLQLHQPPRTKLSPLQEQLRRNVFWDCYIHDRYSSGILGRPYAIAEDDITVDLPIEMTEDEIVGMSTLQDDRRVSSSLPNKASVFRFVITLRRLLTRISNRFYTSLGHMSRRDVSHAASVTRDLNRFLTELDAVRSTAPVISDPTSLYQRSEWYDFLVEKDRLTLLRGAISQMPVDRLHPPHRLLLLTLTCATKVLDLYNSMFSTGHITWTRSYFQIMFTSGLSIMYTLSILKQEKRILEFGVTVADETCAHASRALVTTSELMKMFVSEMPDAGRFALVFEMLVKQYTGTGTRARPSRGVSPLRGGEASDGIQPSADVDVDREVTSMAGVQPFLVTHQQAMDGGHLLEPDFEAENTQSDFDFTYGFDFDDFPNWSMHSANNDNILGQVEASLGEYAWGIPPDESVWTQWDAIQGIT